MFALLLGCGCAESEVTTPGSACEPLAGYKKAVCLLENGEDGKAIDMMINVADDGDVDARKFLVENFLLDDDLYKKNLNYIRSISMEKSNLEYIDSLIYILVKDHNLNGLSVFKCSLKDSVNATEIYYYYYGEWRQEPGFELRAAKSIRSALLSKEAKQMMMSDDIERVSLFEKLAASNCQ
ncbi:hypothetical protein [Asticcacaulis sp.]|uniref:hypothetical protein n=1 Tax=Asticcacaulis sp. TaxID=1872648 RepID=UPI00391C2417